MSTMLKYLLFITSTFTIAQMANATDYYVSAAAYNSGVDTCTSDNGDGSLANPWGSLYYASTRTFRPGDTLYIRAGVYRSTDNNAFGGTCAVSNGQNVVLKISGQNGAAGSPITIRPYQNEKVVIDTSPMNFNAGWTRCESASQCGSCSGISVPNYLETYYKSSNNGSGPRVQIYSDPGLLTAGSASPGVRLGWNGRLNPTSAGDGGYACSDINKLTSRGTFTTVGGSTAMTVVRLQDGGAPSTHTLICSSEIGNCGTHAMYVGNSSYVTIDGACASGGKCMQILGGYYANYVTNSNNIAFKNFYSHNNGTNEYGNAVRLGSGVSDFLVDSLDIEDVNAECIALYGGGVNGCSPTEGHKRITIQNSSIKNCGRDVWGMKGWSQTLGDGIFTKGADEVKILRNTVNGTTRDGITLSPSGSCNSNNGLISGNKVIGACTYSRDGECAGIGLKQHSSSTAGPSTIHNNIIENNIVDMRGFHQWNDVRGIRETDLPPDGTVSPSQYGGNIYRFNTVDVSGGSNSGPALMIDAVSSSVQASTLIGNIFLGNAGSATVCKQSSAPMPTHSLNTYWPPSATNTAWSGAGCFSGTTRANIVASFESTAIQSAPVFSDTTNYILSSTSAQRDAGGNNCSGKDFLGNTRPMDAGCEIGGMEIGGVAPPPPPADTTKPNVSITSPAGGAVLSGTTTLQASASDNVGVVGVQFYIDDAIFGVEVTSSPYAVNLNTASLTNAAHTIKARARDAAGNWNDSAVVSVTVNNAPPPPVDTTAPTVTLTSPANGATISGVVNVAATASDNVGVVGVKFTLDSTVLVDDTTAPYQVSLDTSTLSNGSHVIKAQARDAAGLTKEVSATVTVNNAPPPALVTVVIDNLRLGQSNSEISFAGKWCRTSLSGSLGSRALYSCGRAIDSYRFTPAIPVQGTYEIYVRYMSTSSYTSQASVAVNSAAGVSRKTIDQRAGSGTWVLIGTFNLIPGQNHSIELTELEASKLMSIDAIMLKQK